MMYWKMWRCVLSNIYNCQYSLLGGSFKQHSKNPTQGTVLEHPPTWSFSVASITFELQNTALTYEVYWSIYWQSVFTRWAPFQEVNPCCDRRGCCLRSAVSAMTKSFQSSAMQISWVSHRLVQRTYFTCQTRHGETGTELANDATLIGLLRRKLKEINFQRADRLAG